MDSNLYFVALYTLFAHQISHFWGVLILPRGASFFSKDKKHLFSVIRVSDQGSVFMPIFGLSIGYGVHNLADPFFSRSTIVHNLCVFY